MAHSHDRSITRRITAWAPGCRGARWLTGPFGRPPTRPPPPRFRRMLVRISGRVVHQPSKSFHSQHDEPARSSLAGPSKACSTEFIKVPFPGFASFHCACLCGHSTRSMLTPPGSLVIADLPPSLEHLARRSSASLRPPSAPNTTTEFRCFPLPLVAFTQVMLPVLRTHRAVCGGSQGTRSGRTLPRPPTRLRTMHSTAGPSSRMGLGRCTAGTPTAR